VAPEAWSGAALGGWGTVAAGGGGWSSQRDKGEAASSESVNQKGKRISLEDATDARARWAGRGSFFLRGQRGQRAGWARGRVGRKVGRAKNKEKGIS
jgi:hypothetical protein